MLLQSGMRTHILQTYADTRVDKAHTHKRTHAHTHTLDDHSVVMCLTMPGVWFLQNENFQINEGFGSFKK